MRRDPRRVPPLPVPTRTVALSFASDSLLDPPRLQTRCPAVRGGARLANFVRIRTVHVAPRPRELPRVCVDPARPALSSSFGWFEGGRTPRNSFGSERFLSRPDPANFRACGCACVVRARAHALLPGRADAPLPARSRALPRALPRARPALSSSFGWFEGGARPAKFVRIRTVLAAPDTPRTSARVPVHFCLPTPTRFCLPVPMRRAPACDRPCTCPCAAMFVSVRGLATSIAGSRRPSRA